MLHQSIFHFFAPALLAAATILTSLTGANAQTLLEGEEAMQARDYEKAVELLSKVDGKDKEEAGYLRSAALYLGKQYPESEKASADFLAAYPESKWKYKARHLQARALIAQKKHKEAEVILSAEAKRVFSSERKQKIAEVLVGFADNLAREPKPNELDALPPDYNKALALYNQVLALEIERELRDDIQFKVATTLKKLNKHGEAAAAYRKYLLEFDPTWSGAVGSDERRRGQLKEKPVLAGKHRMQARLGLIDAQLAQNQHPAARQNIDELFAILEKEKADDQAFLAEVGLRRVRSHDRNSKPEQQVAVRREFLVNHPAHKEAPGVARWIGVIYENAGQPDKAVAAYGEFLAGKNFKFITDEANTTPDAKTGISAAEQLTKWKQSVAFKIGQLRFNQKKFTDAIKEWQKYVVQYPNGAEWASSQSGIINAEFLIGLDSVSSGEDQQAREQFSVFLRKYPLDGRARQIMFILGQMHYDAAEKFREGKQKAKVADINTEYGKAITSWSRLISKYPNTEESSLALYRTGVIQAERLGKLEDALATFRQLTWGSWANPAKARVTLMSRESLGVATERTFRTNETPSISVTARNLEKLKVSLYPLNLESYFRKTHQLARIDHLDIDLIEPEKVWEVKLKDYEKYREIIQNIEIPFEGNKPGIRVVKIEGGDWSATTLVVRSDIEIIVKSSRKEVLVYAEDQLKGKPAAGASLLFSDGKSIITAGKTGNDGVFRGKFDELQSINDIRVLATSSQGSASNLLNIGNLRFSTGLTPRGYIYTDKSAYRAGEKVSVRGIIRHVKDGSYLVPEKRDYVVRISDPAGKLLSEAELKLSEFGSFDTSVDLPQAASLGTYNILAHPKDKKAETYQGNFQVQKFKLDRVQLAFDFPQNVYFRGERVSGNISARYYWGSPAADKLVEISLPDGRKLSRKTDAKGELAIDLDTSGFQPGMALNFSARLPALDITTSKSVFLAQLGFQVSVKPDQPLVLAKENFEVNVNTRGADGKPVGKDLILTVLRSQVARNNPILEAVPWITHTPAPSAEVTVKEIKVTTDGKTGEGTAILNLEAGGNYTLRISGQDRFDQTVTGSTLVQVSDDDDAQKVRFFSDKTTYEVGSTIPLRLHSRVAKNLALLTYEGEEVLGYKIISLKKGDNTLEVPVEHAHFPNFRVSVALIDGRNLRAASRRFNITRKLTVTIKPAKDVFLPGEQGKVDITVTDQLGKPAKAELALSLVNQALQDIYPDNKPDIVTFFQQGAARYAEFSLVSTCSFAYTALSQKRKSSGTQGELYDTMGNGIEQLGRINGVELALNPTNSALVMTCMSNHASIFNNGRVQPLNLPGNSAPQLGVFLADGAVPVSGMVTGGGVDGFSGGATNFRGVEFQSFSLNEPGDINVTQMLASGQRIAAGGGAGGRASGPNSLKAFVSPDSHWISPVVTDDAGKATVTLTLPSRAGKWLISAKGATVETLVGQTSASVITRKDFLVELRTPDTLQEGDTMQFLATVHNLTDFEGDAQLTLTVGGAEQPFRSVKTAKIQKNGSAEVVFDALTIPFTEILDVKVEAKAGERSDVSASALRVRPWGLEFASHAGGITDGTAGAKLKLPVGKNYTGQKLLVSLSPSIEQAIIDLALERMTPLVQLGNLKASSYRSPRPQSASSALLASVSALKYARDRGASEDELARLTERVIALASTSTVTQRKDGAWPWNSVRENSALMSTATSYWGLALARKAGIPVHQGAFDSAEKYFADVFAKLPSNDNEAKAIIIHALSVTGKADFSAANRLYRERNELNEFTLAYMAAAFVRMERQGFAEDLLQILEKKVVAGNGGGAPSAYWRGGSSRSLMRDPAETTALVLWTYANLRRESPLASKASNYLLTESANLNSNRSLGAIIAGLTAYHNQGGERKDDFEVDIRVGDKLVHTIKSKDLANTSSFSIPQGQINAGENQVRIDVRGRGEVRYSATLSGFSPDLQDPESIEDTEFVHRHYYHERLSYRDVPLKTRSTSPVVSLEVGQRFRTHVEIESNDQKNYLIWEEHIPAGTMLVQNSLRGNFKRVEYHGSMMRMSFAPGSVGNLQYELVAQMPGTYRVLPGVIHDAVDRGLMRVGPQSAIKILLPEEKSQDPYKTNPAEHFELAAKQFKDGNMNQAQAHLDALFGNNYDRVRYERDLARMLLWIHTSREKIDAPRVVQMFEILRERHPDLVIPFDKILTVGRAYREIGEFERAWLVFNAAIQSSFLNDSRLSAVLEDQGKYLGSVRYQEDLWFEYPDSANVVTAYFALSQILFQKAPEAKAIAARERQIREKAKPAAADDEDAHAGPDERKEPEKVAMLEHSRRLLHRFLTLYPENPLADDAAFSEVNVFFALKDYANVIKYAERSIQRHKKSDFTTSFQYMASLGHFWLRQYADALKSAIKVAEGASKDRDYARYITAQIYHATGKPGDAMDWYRKVKQLYPDASEAIDYFEEKRIGIKEVTTFKPGEAAELEINYRNIKEASLLVYKVDLMKLYLREKNLSNITKVDLAGIDPESSLLVNLGEGKDFADKTNKAKLPIKEEGAYLVICRGDDLFTSGLVLITPLKLEIQENSKEGSVRVNVRSSVEDDAYMPEVLVKVVGTNNDVFFSGHTDLRGVFQADGVNGTATVLARGEKGHYAFYRGSAVLGAPPAPAAATRNSVRGGKVQVQQNSQKPAAKKQLKKSDYLQNIDTSNRFLQDSNWKAWDKQRRGKNEGVEVQEAY